MSAHRALPEPRTPIRTRTKVLAGIAVASALAFGGGELAGAASSSPSATCDAPSYDGSNFSIHCTIPQSTTTAPGSTTTETTTAPGSTTTVTAPGSTTTVTQTQTVTSSPTSTSASPTTSAPTSSSPPPVDTGVASAADTGYTHANCPNGRTTFSGTIKSNTTYSCMNFPSGVFAGSQTSAVTGVTFYGDNFTASGASTAAVGLFGTNFTISYSTISGSYEYGIEGSGAYHTHVDGLEVDHTDISGFACAVDTNGNNQTYTYLYIHDPRNASGDHTDGIGSLDDGAGTNLAITHSYINADANTNGIAFQGGTWSHMTVTDNHLGGFGYTVHIGDTTSFIDFERNTYLGGAFYGPVYPVNFWSSTGSVWAHNLLANGQVWNHP